MQSSFGERCHVITVRMKEVQGDSSKASAGFIIQEEALWRGPQQESWSPQLLTDLE
jgi:hypothetical protein